MKEPIEEDGSAWGEPVFGIRTAVRPTVGGGYRFELCIQNEADAVRYVESHGGLLATMKIRLIGPDGKEPLLTVAGTQAMLGAYDGPGTRSPFGSGVRRCRTIDLGVLYKFDQPGRYEFSFSQKVFLTEFGEKGTATSNTASFVVAPRMPVEAPKP